MSDVPVYMLANLEVDDADRYREYEKGFFPILERHGGEFVTFDDATATLEGASPPPGRTCKTSCSTATRTATCFRRSARIGPTVSSVPIPGRSAWN